MINKKIHYIWFWRGKKSDNFKKYIDSWKKFCPDYEIKEWNEGNYDITKNEYLKYFYDKKKYAFAADYARFDILYNEWWIYLDTDIEIIKNIDNLLNSDWFISFQDIIFLWGSIIWAEKWNKIIKEFLDFYKNKKRKIIITQVLGKILKEKWLKIYNWKIQNVDNFMIYTKDYFYPYAFFENKKNMKITKNTFVIHHYEASWLPKYIQILTFPIIWIFLKIKQKILFIYNK